MINRQTLLSYFILPFSITLVLLFLDSQHLIGIVRQPVELVTVPLKRTFAFAREQNHFLININRVRQLEQENQRLAQAVQKSYVDQVEMQRLKEENVIL